MKRFIVLMTVFFCLFLPSCETEENTITSYTNTIIGMVLSESGNPIVSAKVCIGNDSVYSKTDGSFELNTSLKSNQTIKVTVSGFFDFQENIILTDSYTKLEDIILISQSSSDFQSISDPGNFSEMKSVLELNGFAILNDDVNNSGLTDTHVNGFLKANTLKRKVTLGDLAKELVNKGIKLGSIRLTKDTVISILQETLRSAYVDKDDPRFFSALYPFTDENGNLPPQVPILTEYTELSAEKAASLYSAITFILTHPLKPEAQLVIKNTVRKELEGLSPGQAFKALQSGGFWQKIWDGLQKFGHAAADYFVGVAAEITRYVGRLLGMYIGIYIAAGLDVLTGELSAPLSGYITQSGAQFGEKLGNYVADFLVRQYEGLIGRPIYSGSQTTGRFLKSDGTPGFTSDVTVILSWSSESKSIDLSLKVKDPDGTIVSTTNPNSDVGKYELDSYANGGPDIYLIPRGKAINGQYEISIEYDNGFGFAQAKVDICFNDGLPHESKKELGIISIGTPGSSTVVGDFNWPPEK